MVSTFQTIGFRDIAAQNPQEILFVIVIQLSQVLINAYIIGVLVSILTNQIETSFIHKYSSFISNFQFKKIPDHLLNEILHYFQYNYYEKIGSDNSQLKRISDSIPFTIYNSSRRVSKNWCF